MQKAMVWMGGFVVVLGLAMMARADVPARATIEAEINASPAPLMVERAKATWLLKKEAEEEWYRMMLYRNGDSARMGVRAARLASPPLLLREPLGSVNGAEASDELVQRVAARALRAKFREEHRRVAGAQEELATLLEREQIERIALDRYYLRTEPSTELDGEELIIEYRREMGRRTALVDRLTGAYRMLNVPYRTTLGANGPDDDCDAQSGQVVILSGGGGGGGGRYHVDSFFDVFTNLPGPLTPRGGAVMINRVLMEKMSGSCDGVDNDCDGVVEEEEYYLFQTCYTGQDDGPIRPECLGSDLDDDNDVDGYDWQEAKKIMEEAGMPATDLIPSGTDCYDIMPELSYVEFGGTSGLPPIPADFFFPGSLPWEGPIKLMDKSTPGFAPPVQMKREEWADLSAGAATINSFRLENAIVVSSTPLLVIALGGEEKEYMVTVTVTDNNVPAKTMHITGDGENVASFFDIYMEVTLDFKFYEYWPGMTDYENQPVINLIRMDPVLYDSKEPCEWKKKKAPEVLSCGNDMQDFYADKRTDGCETDLNLPGGEKIGTLSLMPLGGREACCLPDAACVDVPVRDCAAMQGDPQGPGTSCAAGDIACATAKWAQPPVPGPVSDMFYGWNEYSVWDMPGQGPSAIVADDWVCETNEPVSDLHWWGSYIGWRDPVPPGSLQQPPVDHFHILIWTDVPAGVDTTFSHPGEVIWEVQRSRTDVNEQFVGWDFNPAVNTFDAAFHYDLDLQLPEWFYQDPSPGARRIYWVTIAACYEPNPIFPMPYPWGWKTRPRDVNSPAPDAAVTIFNPWWATLGSTYQSGEPICWPGTSLCGLADQWDMAFELTTKTTLSVFKWEQGPDLAQTGMDVNATHPLIAADDFQCTMTGPLTQLAIVGSWRDDILPSGGAGNLTFRLALHADLPANQNPDGSWSAPGFELWRRSFMPGQFTVQPLATGLAEGWMDPPSAYDPTGDTVAYTYVFDLNPGDFTQTGSTQSPAIYWLEVQAVPASGPTPTYFGWKTSGVHWNDDATWHPGGTGIWQELRYPWPHPQAGQSIDLAFTVVGTGLSDPTLKWSQPPEPYSACFYGWNEYSVYGSTQWIVADDWPCETDRPITDMHWWGSYLYWTDDSPPSVAPDAFHIGIWTDVPAGPVTETCCYCWNPPGVVPPPTCSPNPPDPATCWIWGGGQYQECTYYENSQCTWVSDQCQSVRPPFSHPGVLLQGFVVPRSILNERPVGCDVYYQGLAPETCFKYDWHPIPDATLFAQPDPACSIYWISISAVYSGVADIPNPWGWKTREHVYMDEAVRIFSPTAPSQGALYESGEPLTYEGETSFDMAFVLTTPEEKEACCLMMAVEPVCQLLEPAVCFQQGGIRQGPGTVCSLVEEACCMPDGSCIMIDPLCCDELSGIPQGPGSVCEGMQACCFAPPNAYCQDMDALCCRNAGGTPDGPGTNCTAQACCYPNGDCSMLAECLCELSGGVPQGAGSDCSLMDCPQPEACCFVDATCSDLLPANCSAIDGTPQGPGTFCMGDNDGNGVDDACEPPCHPRADGLACSLTICPNPLETCVPTQALCVGPGVCRITECQCQPGDACHIDLDAQQQPICVGDCPPGEDCVHLATTQPDQAVLHICECQPACEPTPDGTDCIGNPCGVDQACVPKRVRHNEPQAAFPEPGIDALSPTTGYVVMRDPTGAEATYHINPVLQPNITRIQREEAICLEERRTLNAEIIETQLVAEGPGGMAVMIRESPMRASAGIVAGPTGCAADYPADSFFDVFVEIDIPDLGIYGLYNPLPIPVLAMGVTQLPPLGNVYHSLTGWEGVEMLTASGEPTGYYLIEAEHVPPPPPPEWEVVECACIDAAWCHWMFPPAWPYCTGECWPGTECILHKFENWLECDCGPGVSCCLPDGTCLTVSEDQCVAQGGVPQGAATECTQAVACCWVGLTGQTLCSNTDALCCDDMPQGEISPWAAVCLGDNNGNQRDDACDPPCEPAPDGQSCYDAFCPIEEEFCRPKAVRHNVAQPFFPEAGTDTLTPTTGYVVIADPTGAEATYSINPEKLPNVTRIIRESPTDVAGRREIEAEIIETQLVADGPGGMAVMIRESPTRASTGRVVGRVSDVSDYPADSFFDLFVEIDIPYLGVYGLYNAEPIPMETHNVTTMPPSCSPAACAAYHSAPAWQGVELLDALGQPTGYRVVEAEHVPPPPPPEWEMIECACTDPHSCHVEWQAGADPHCVGGCPSGQCLMSVAIIDPGIVEHRCGCTQLEACCWPNGQCEDLLPERCRELGGRSQGPKKTCDNITCPPVEVDVFPNTSALMELQMPDGDSVPIALSGPTTVHVFFEGAGEGEAQDHDGDGLDEVTTELVDMQLSGASPFGPVVVRVHPTEPSQGEIEETANTQVGWLDMPPFAPAGTAASFFDVFFEIRVGGMAFHTETPKRMSSVINHKPPEPGNIYENLEKIPLLDENGNATGFSIGAARHVPRPQCGSPGTGDCFGPHDAALCNRAECCERVCELAPNCCATSWSTLCAELAYQLCAVPQACCLPNGRCKDLPEAVCELGGGRPQGAETVCERTRCERLGDCNSDDHVDLRDFVRFQNCFVGGGPPRNGCGCADLDGDGDVDLIDLRIFDSNMNGP